MINRHSLDTNIAFMYSSIFFYRKLYLFQACLIHMFCRIWWIQSFEGLDFKKSFIFFNINFLNLSFLNQNLPQSEDIDLWISMSLLIWMKFLLWSKVHCTAKRKVERLQFSTSSSFVKIWSVCSCEFKAYFWTFWALYHLLFDLETIGVN